MDILIEHIYKLFNRKNNIKIVKLNNEYSKLYINRKFIIYIKKKNLDGMHKKEIRNKYLDKINKIYHSYETYNIISVVNLIDKIKTLKYIKFLNKNSLYNCKILLLINDKKNYDFCIKHNFDVYFSKQKNFINKFKNCTNYLKTLNVRGFIISINNIIPPYNWIDNIKRYSLRKNFVSYNKLSTDHNILKIKKNNKVFCDNSYISYEYFSDNNWKLNIDKYGFFIFINSNEYIVNDIHKIYINHFKIYNNIFPHCDIIYINNNEHINLYNYNNKLDNDNNNNDDNNNDKNNDNNNSNNDNKINTNIYYNRNKFIVNKKVKCNKIYINLDLDETAKLGILEYDIDILFTIYVDDIYIDKAKKKKDKYIFNSSKYKNSKYIILYFNKFPFIKKLNYNIEKKSIIEKIHIDNDNKYILSYTLKNNINTDSNNNSNNNNNININNINDNNNIINNITIDDNIDDNINNDNDNNNDKKLDINENKRDNIITKYNYIDKIKLINNFDLNKKNIIFVGPMGNPTKSQLDQYDYVIRTNNFFSIKNHIIKSKRCDILVVNRFFIKNRFNVINENINKVKFIMSEKSNIDLLKKKLNKKFHNKLINMIYNKMNFDYIVESLPLMLTRILYFIIPNFKPSKLYITGLDFYNSKNIKKFRLEGYSIPSDKETYKLPFDTSKHKPDNDKKFLKYYMDKFKWINCDNIIYKIII